ncbi:hypothetical protein Efla_004562 [Eimeria flavescens]
MSILALSVREPETPALCGPTWMLCVTLKVTRGKMGSVARFCFWLAIGPSGRQLTRLDGCCAQWTAAALS